MARALVDRISGWTVARRLGGMLTGDYDDLRRLVATMKGAGNANFGLMALLRTMEREIETRSGMAALFARVGRQLNPRAKRMLLRNLIYNWAAIAARCRIELAAAGKWVPS